MQFATPITRARITYAIIMASTTCVIMSAITTTILSPQHFWHHWPRVLGIDLIIANPIAVLLGPVVRRLCFWLYPSIKK